VRVRDLHDFRRVIVELAAAREAPLVVVPTRSAASQMDVRAECVTRDELYDRLHARLPTPPRRLTPFERDAIAQAAAVESAEHPEGRPAFRLRPGLVAEMLRFYDYLRRQSQSVDRFEELLLDAIGPSSLAANDARGGQDRGAERMAQQTRFLGRAFRAYERRVEASGACDEHGLRDRLVAETPEHPVRHVIVTVPDWIADPSGLFVADFDLLARMPAIETLDIVCTEGVLGSGFHERLDRWWPGLEETAAAAITGAIEKRPPLLITPETCQPDEPWFTFRDREEELVAVARRIAARGAASTDLSRIAVVFKRPLPYLYLAADTLGSAAVQYRTHDALPLAAEPVAAAVDLVLECVESHFARDGLIALLRSPHLDVAGAGGLSRESIAALDRALSDARYLGELQRLESLAPAWAAARAGSPERIALPALKAAVAVARELAALLESAAASLHLRHLSRFVSDRWKPLADDAGTDGRERRGRAAVGELLEALASAHAAHHDPHWAIDELAHAVRRWIGDRTFAPETGDSGVHLIDDQAARYGDFDEMIIVGLIDQDWPERPRRNIFYPPTLLKALGWPSEMDRRAAADVRFLELAASAARYVALSTFLLDDEALVMRSTQLDEIARARLSTVAQKPFEDDDVPRLRPESNAWSDARLAAQPLEAPRFHGFVGPQERRTWSVSALETYLSCPFKFFAQHVLRLEEEPDDEEVMDPRREGLFVHQVFEAFFREWQRDGRGSITAANLDDARATFAAVVDRELARLPDAAEAGLERTRLLGSPAAAGLGDAVLRMEAERPVAVIERLLEHELKDEFEIRTTAGVRTVTTRGKADRLDLLADGTFRLIDYKLGWPPDRSRALQLPIYGLCAGRWLAQNRGGAWVLAEAVYLAFKGPKRVVPLFTSAAHRDEVLAKAQQRLADTLDSIERGEFPPRPDDVFRCETCSYAAVCRKDYAGEV
jgi:RecB family exonuclease